MNVRVLELIQRPENILAEDISVLKTEISKYPYMQSIRTLYLSAVHQFDEENYQKELTTTAAYTTDKKILYHFINFKKENEKKELTKLKKINLLKESEPQVSLIPEVNNAGQSLVNQNVERLQELKEEKPVAEVVDDGNEVVAAEASENQNTGNEELVEVNNTNSVIGDTELEMPIIDKKENEFEVLQEEENLELESQIFAELAAEEEKQKEVFKTREGDLNFSKDTVLEDLESLNSEEVTPSEISFNAFDSFLPDVKFTIPSPKEVLVVQEPLPAEHEEVDDINAETSDSNENLNPTQLLEVGSNEVLTIEEPFEVFENQEETVIEEPVVEILDEEIMEQDIAFDWKPMSFVQNPLDAQIKFSEPEKPVASIAPIVEKVDVDEVQPQEIIKIEEIAPQEIAFESIIEKEETNEENHFSDVEEIAPKDDLEEPMIEPEVNTEEERVIEHEVDEGNSNIPNFVNTWQNWLKIDRADKQEEEPQKIIEKKADIIDKFIEENPKISQLKEETNFIVKEKANDISHLMTETLAKLYVEQRLYTKAITAYEALQKKHPEKHEEFEGRIQEIKDLKYNK